MAEDELVVACVQERLDQASSSGTTPSASGTERRVEKSDLPWPENSLRRDVCRTRTRWIDQSTSRHRSASSSPWRKPVIAAGQDQDVDHRAEHVGRRRRRAAAARPERLGLAHDDVFGDCK